MGATFDFMAAQRDAVERRAEMTLAKLDDAARRVRLEPLVGHETTVTLGFEPDRALRSKDGVRSPLSRGEQTHP